MSRAGALLRRLPYAVGYRHGPRLMSKLRRRWVLLRHPLAEIVIDQSAYLGPGFSLDIPASGTFVAGARSHFRRGFRAEIVDGGRIEIGPDSVFTYDVLIGCSTEVTIGAHCVLAQASAVFDGSHRFRDMSKPMLEQGYDLRPIRIGDHVTVSAKCTVINDIGERTFVGANSVVSKPLPARCLAVGAPAVAIEVLDSGEPGSDAAGA